VLGLVSSVLSQEICWEERLQNDLFCVEWAPCGPGAITSPLSLHFSIFYSYLLVSFNFSFLSRFIYFLAFQSLPVLPE